MLIGVFVIILFTSSVKCTSSQLDFTEFVNLEDITVRSKQTHSYVAKIEKFGKQVCTCVLIDDQVAIALRTCIKGQLLDFKVRIQDVRSGKFTLTKILRTMKLANDKSVILIELDKNFPRINTPPIARFSMEKKPFCKVVGFRSNGKDLKDVKINTESSNKCSGIGKKDFCFNTTNEASLCQTGNGFPIVCKYEKKWYLTGLALIKKGCKKQGIYGVNIAHLRQSIQKAIEKMNKDGSCLTSGCRFAASRVLDAIDKDINPCDSFYDFACGKWIKRTSIPRDLPYYSSNYEMYDSNMLLLKSKVEEEITPSDIEAVVKAKTFYKSCTNTKKIENQGNGPIHAFVESMGGLPMLGDAPGGGWDPRAFSLENLIVKSFHVTPDTPIISSYIADYMRPSNRYILRLDQPEMDSFLTGNDSIILMAYQTYLEETYKAFGANDSTAAAYAKDIVNLEVDIAKALVPSENRRYAYLSVAELQKYKQPEVNLTKIVEGVYESGGIPLDTSKKLIFNIQYIYFIGGITRKYSESVIASYIVSKIAVSHLSYLPKVYTDIFDKFSQVFGAPTAPVYTWRFCVDTLVQRMPYVIGRLYVDETFLEEEKSHLVDVSKRHLDVFRGMLKKQSWISKGLKKKLIEKASKMTIAIGYPTFVQNDTILNEIHEQVTVYVDDPFKSLLSLLEAEMARAVESLTREFDDNPWTSSPVSVNALYSRTLNAVILFAGYFQPRRYSFDMPEYMNYGGAGVVIGHEISHGFDANGRLYTSTGVKDNDLWPPKDDRKYMKRIGCLVEQYSNFTVPGTGGLKHNGILTTNENIADNGGMKIGYEAYRKWVKTTRKGKDEKKLPGLPYSPDQMFFLNYAQTRCFTGTNEYKKNWIQTIRHSLPRFRVTGMMQNSKDFAKAWNCPIGSNMNPAKKCSIFY